MTNKPNYYHKNDSGESFDQILKKKMKEESSNDFHRMVHDALQNYR